tara:strand:- start:330 stop:869 length:540 start_codon:yes stop_codon:yes gene_type:complete
MWALVKDGKVEKVFMYPTGWKDESGTSHPRTAMELWTKEELVSKNIYSYTPFTDHENLFYRLGETSFKIDKKNHTVVELCQMKAIKVSDAKALVIEAIRKIATSKLAETDYMMLKAFEFDKLPQEVKDANPDVQKYEFSNDMFVERWNVRNTCHKKEQEVKALKTTKDVSQYDYNDGWK